MSVISGSTMGIFSGYSTAETIYSAAPKPNPAATILFGMRCHFRSVTAHIPVMISSSRALKININALIPSNIYI